MNAYQSLMTKTREQNLLYSALIELTYQCNLDCFFCYNDLSMHGKRMQLQDHRKLLEDLAGMNVLSVSLSGGEPLACPHFFEIGAYAKELGFLITVKTNGHMVGPRIAKRLRREVDPYIIETSLHGACSATHDRQTRVAGSFDRLMKNIPAMLDEGMKVNINSALTAWNENEVEGMFAIADRLGVKLQIDTDVTPRDDGDMEPLSISASDEGIREMLKFSMRRAAKAKSKVTIPIKLPATEMSVRGASAPRAKEKKLKNCAVGSSVVSIDPFGNVYPCVALRLKVGDLHENSIVQIWNGSKELEAIREMAFKAHEFKLSKGFSGFCPGVAQTTNGNPVSIYPDIVRKTRIINEIQQQTGS